MLDLLTLPAETMKNYIANPTTSFIITMNIKWVQNVQTLHMHPQCLRMAKLVTFKLKLLDCWCDWVDRQQLL